jgi:DNA repair protein RadD
VSNLPDHLWPPQRRGIEQTLDALQRGKRVCLFSPTGGGKTEQAIQLLKWAETGGLGGCFYVNRRLLIAQTAARFEAAGLRYGIRAAEYEDKFEPDAPFQVCSADTERSRVLERKTWPLHNGGRDLLVVVDEAHIQKSGGMRKLAQMYREAGSMIVLLTATPIGLSQDADELVVSGSLAEYRDCKALVPAKVYTLQTPDLRKVQRNQTGEFILDGKKKKIYTQTIVGSVLESIKKYNPDLRPMMLYAPGKAESAWFCGKLLERGIAACHVDATDALLDGVRYPLTRPLWDDILGRYKDGSIKCLCSRFKLREGIDVPDTYHCILATPIGSLASYIQTVGRVLRYSAATPDHVIVTDHGGNYLRHGSPNDDRDWQAFWHMPEHAVSHHHENRIRDGKAPEPICCPRCKGERKGGPKCPHCGHVHDKSQREVIEEDGTLVLRDGNLVPRRRILNKPNTADLWERMFWGWRKKGVRRSFSQMYGYFTHEHGYSPPRDLPYMPKSDTDWTVKVPDLDLHHLIGHEGKVAA